MPLHRLPRRGLPALLSALTLMTTTPASSSEAPDSTSAPELTIARILGSPSLSGDTPRAARISPDGSRVTLLRPRPDDAERLDLWEIDVESGAWRMLVDSERLDPDDAELSDEEKARRERQRIPGTRGIVEYVWSPAGDRLAFPLGGDVWIVDLDPGEGADQGDGAVRPIENREGFATDVKFSPTGRWVSFVRDQNLWIADVEKGTERPLTTDGGGPIKNGMAEFVVQEELSRYTGYWWSPDERWVASVRVDETPVPITRRHEIYADRVEIVEQRYPFAGKDNVDWELQLIEVETGERRTVPLPAPEGAYLYRAKWFPRGGRLAVQALSRSQKRLDLIAVDAEAGTADVLLTEVSPIWVELSDDLTFLEESDEFVWSSRRSGYQHLALHSWDGQLVRALTSGEWEVVASEGDGAVAAIDEDARRVYFTATRDSPLERHLYVQSLDTEDPEDVRRVTDEVGTHEIEMADDGSVYLDTFSSPDQPPRVALHAADGARIAWVTENALDEDHPYSPFLDGHPFPEFGTLEADDGQVLHTRLYRPAGFDADDQWPVLVYVYGGPGGQQVRRQWGGAVDLWLRWMARRGVAVFTLDNRGTGSRGVLFDLPLYRRMANVEVKDQLLGLEWLKAQPWVDPERIGVFGWSYGGYMALHLLGEAPGAFAAGVSGAPVTDWTLYDTAYTERYLDRPQDNPGGYEASSAFSRVDAITDPLLLVHGMADDNVLFTNTTRVLQVLQEADRPFELMTYPGAKHSLCRVPGTGEHCLGTITRFLDRHLLPGN